ncbi:prepilin-type N-terminal cleavage/methylation domain-containing protein [bacterium]|nr:prepilin-type N-terminal cleavage/methylation domain-containing protein [bacterium]
MIKSSLIHFKMKSGGFTLVELIIILVIIGILSSVAILRFMMLTDTAKASLCIANQQTLNAAQAMYLAQTSVNTGYSEYADDLNDLIPFIDSGTVPECPIGGTYEIDPVSGIITCSLTEHIVD